MATITPTRIKTPADVDFEIWKWAGMTLNDVGVPVLCNYKQDKSIYFICAAGTTTSVSIQGTPDPGPPFGGGSVGAAGFATLHDPQGNALSGAAVQPAASTMNTKAVLEVCYALRPLVDGAGNETGIDIWLVMKGR